MRMTPTFFGLLPFCTCLSQMCLLPCRGKTLCLQCTTPGPTGS